MQRFFIGVLILLLLLVACRALTPDTEIRDTPPPSKIAASPTPAPTSPATAPPPTSKPTAVPISPTASPVPSNLVFDIRTHPDGGLFVGDNVSFEVIPPPDVDLKDDVLRISVGDAPPFETHFAPYGIGGRWQATVFWGWDTSGLEPDDYPLEFSIQPLGFTWTHTITLGSAVEIPPPEPSAEWATAESDCCIFHYITDTAAAREITATLVTADELADNAVSTLKVEFTEPLVITLMSRVLGQGGFASTEMYISLLDRDYAGNNLETVLHHEMVHILDHRLGGELRPSILIEGLAVYLTGGHYKPEELIPRAATLLPSSEREDSLGLGWILPLRPLVDDFYNTQHEIGYLQAGALVEFMIDTWGWEAYSNFYRDIQPIQNGTQSEAFDAALQSHFGLTLDELEADFLALLQAQALAPEIVEDVRLTVEYFDAMRRYQQVLDPSAYFLTAWLPDGPLMREKGIVSDLVRRSSEIKNLALETLLVSANDFLHTSDYESATDAIEAVNAVLDAIEAENAAPFEAHPLAAAHFEIITILSQMGYQAEKINVDGAAAQVIASQGWPELTMFEFQTIATQWQLENSQ
jgi:hypothetical protein